MTKFKNAIRKHFIAAYDPEHPDTPPTEDKYMWIAKGVKETTPENDEEDDDVAYFDGDGTKEKVITSKSRGRSFEGHREYGDKAQDFIADKEDALADDLVVWYKELVPTGKYYKEGLGRLSGIEIGEGEASDSKLTGHVLQRNMKSRQQLLAVQLLDLLEHQYPLLVHHQKQPHQAWVDNH